MSSVALRSDSGVSGHRWDSVVGSVLEPASKAGALPSASSMAAIAGWSSPALCWAVLEQVGHRGLLRREQ